MLRSAQGRLVVPCKTVVRFDVPTECGHAEEDHVLLKDGEGISYRDRKFIGEVSCRKCWLSGKGADIHKYEGE